MVPYLCKELHSWPWFHLWSFWLNRHMQPRSCGFEDAMIKRLDDKLASIFNKHSSGCDQPAVSQLKTYSGRVTSQIRVTRGMRGTGIKVVSFRPLLPWGMGSTDIEPKLCHFAHQRLSRRRGSEYDFQLYRFHSVSLSSLRVVDPVSTTSLKVKTLRLE